MRIWIAPAARMASPVTSASNISVRVFMPPSSPRPRPDSPDLADGGRAVRRRKSAQTAAMLTRRSVRGGIG